MTLHISSRATTQHTLTAVQPGFRPEDEQFYSFRYLSVAVVQRRVLGEGKAVPHVTDNTNWAETHVVSIGGKSRINR